MADAEALGREHNAAHRRSTRSRHIITIARK